MFGLILLVGLGAWVLWYQRDVDDTGTVFSSKFSTRLDKLWVVAQESIKDRKYLRAEKALLTILRVDERNATAYNRLGILYAKQRAYQDAIECFEIAQSLEPSASSLHNVGLIYYETGQYEKAVLAFEQALGMEGELAARHIALAKVQEKLGNTKAMIASLERAVELEPNPQSIAILADAYERDNQIELATAMREKVAKVIIPTSAPQKIQQPRKIVM
ncbi:MAG: tetratricopeptide repeat protein [Candidatus Saccharimonadales bacterium]|jgi:superkiller protein 3